MEDLNDSNFLLVAANCYDGLLVEDVEFLEDLSRIVYIKRLLNKYAKCGDLKERLILNHMVILHNMFGTNAIRMMFLKIPEYQSELKTFLNYINIMPDTVRAVKGSDINSGDIPINFIIAQRLSQL